MSAEQVRKNWRGWREAVFATCTVWLVLQNVVLFSLIAWGKPESALAAGAALARTAVSVGGQAIVMVLAAVLGLALAAWLVHAPAPEATEKAHEVNHDV